jgi:hypothetical protein
MKNELLFVVLSRVLTLKSKVLAKLPFLLLIVFLSCTRQENKPIELTPSKAKTQDLIRLSGEMFQKFKDSLDLAHVISVDAKDNMKIYMARFKNNANRIYSVSSLGTEVLYVGLMRDARNGQMAVLKKGEAVLINVKDGFAEIKDLDRKQWGYYFTTQYHGGRGFCQRMKGETFATCYKAEADEFCDSFISCLAVDTQPIVVIVIAAACSCDAKPPVATEHYWWDTAKTPTDTFIRFNKDSLPLLQLQQHDEKK